MATIVPYFGSKIPHTFDKAGNYTVTLAAKDSGIPSQNASANIVVTIRPTVNETVLEALVNANSTNSLDANSTNSLDANSTNSLDANSTNSLDANSTNSLDANSTNSLDANSTNSLDANSTNSLDANSTNSLDANSTNISSRDDILAANGTPQDRIDSWSNSTSVTSKPTEPKLQLENIGESPRTVDKNITSVSSNTDEFNSTNHMPHADDQSVIVDGNKAPNIVLKAIDQDNDKITFDLLSRPLKGYSWALIKIRAT